MNYIKNNKVFIFLFICLSLAIIILSTNILPSNDNNGFTPNPQVNNKIEISNFSANFSDTKAAIELSWNIASGNKKVKEITLNKNDVEFKDVTGNYSVILPINEYNIMTGNNKFDLIVTFDDDTELSKSKYVYVNEAYGFSTSIQNMPDKSVISVTFSYDDRRPVESPNVRFSNTNQPFTMNFVSSEMISESNNTKKKKVVYELLYNNSKRGEYKLPLVFSFPNYNLDIDYNAVFTIATGEIDE